MSSLILSGSSSLSVWLPFIQGQALFAQSKQRRLRRGLAHERIVAEERYDPLIHASPRDWGKTPVFLALDTRVLWEKLCGLRLSVIYPGRAIPVAWKVIKHQSSSMAFELYGPWIQQAA